MMNRLCDACIINKKKYLKCFSFQNFYLIIVVMDVDDQDMISLQPYMECFFATFGFYPDEQAEAMMHQLQHRNQQQEEVESQKQVYEHLTSKFFSSPYPDHFYIPKNRFEVSGQTVSIWKKQRYSPYQRISHFREHLNRIQGCQFVTVPQHIMIAIKQCLQKNYSAMTKRCVLISSSRKCNNSSTMESHLFYDDLYQFVKKKLRKEHWTQYNEHIHYMIHHALNTHVSITYEDFHLICAVFKQLEQAFTKWNTNEKLTAFELEPRKNLFSYYLVVQTLLYMFHYHPHYQLPSLYDEQKRKKYYVLLLALIQSIPLGERLFFLHFERKRECLFCCKHLSHYSFDSDLINLI